jgi:CRP-like cAMP-binding protein/bacterioferritin-associated ferredoxin
MPNTTVIAGVLDQDLSAFLRKALTVAGPFAALSPEARETLVSRARRVVFDAGDLIARAGEPARAMYVVLAGSVQVYSEDASGRAIVHAKLERGRFFGEQALLPGRGGRRNASVRAHSPTMLARIDRATVLEVVEASSELARRLNALGDEQLAQRLAEESGLVLELVGRRAAGAIAERRLADGEVLFRQGDEARDVYVVRAGIIAICDEATGQRKLVRRLRAGVCFGELALLKRSVRGATAVAEGEAVVLAVDGGRFLENYDRSPSLRRALATLERTYELADHGVVTQFAGDLEGEGCITTLYEQPDGRRVVTSLVLDRGSYRLKVRPAAPPRELPRAPLVFRDAATGAQREVALDAAGAVVSIGSIGDWPELPALHALALAGRALPPAALAGFEQTGAIALPAESDAPPPADAGPLRCRCARVRQSAIDQAMADGCRTLVEPRAQLGCGTVCGACVPTLREILGEDVWSPVEIVAEIPLADDVRVFRLKPRHGRAKDFQPGQHVVLQAVIDGAVVERSYTLTSAAGEPDYYEVTIKREPLGRFSRWLFDGGARAGGLRLAGPQGDVFWDRGARPVVCVVAGIGVTPAVAICRARARLAATAGPHRK